MNVGVFINHYTCRICGQLKQQQKSYVPESEFHLMKATKKTTTNGAKASDAAKGDDVKKTEVKVEIKREKPDVTGARARLAFQHCMFGTCTLPSAPTSDKRKATEEVNGKADEPSKVELTRPIKIEAAAKKDKTAPEARCVRTRLL